MPFPSPTTTRAVNPIALIVIKADREASFGVMDAVMESMSKNELERFLIITNNEAELKMREEAGT